MNSPMHGAMPPGNGGGDPAPDARHAYYRELAAGYETKIRQLVPGYEEVLERLSELVALDAPESVLDIGCGTGELTEWLARAAPEARVVALEVAGEMAAAARERLRPMGARVRVLERDVLELDSDDEHVPEDSFHVVHTNFVLHNLPWDRKREAVAKAHARLAQGGVLVWGDLIRFRDPVLQRSQVERRIRHARATGCPEDLIDWNFRKEEEEDFPLTTPETLTLLREVGFPTPEVAWARDTFMVAWARKG